jgi:hypothetical protein
VSGDTQVSLTITELGGTDKLYQRVTIGAVPDEVLLDVFNLYLVQALDDDTWHILVHVCRSWRRIVFASPRRLNLRLLCTPNRLAKNMDVWPSLPIVISNSLGRTTRAELEDVELMIVALKRHDRICKIDLAVTPILLEKPILLAMTGSYPVLTTLRLHESHHWHTINLPVFPDSFFDGFTQHLQELELDRIPFPGLGKLLLSTSSLVKLRLFNIPRSGYISPEVIVTCLSTLTRLQCLSLQFQYPQSQADRARRRPLTVPHIVLPALNTLQFQGDSNYLEDTVSQIDAPRLKSLNITFFDQSVFETPLLRHFISRTEKFHALHRASLVFGSSGIFVILFPPKGMADHGWLMLEVRCRESARRFSSLVQVCGSSLPPLPTLERLHTRGYQSTVQPHMEITGCVKLLRLFTFLKNLDLSGELVPHVAIALKELARESVTEVLPALQNIFVDGRSASEHVKEDIEQFVAARQLSGFPVVVHYREEGGG